MLSWQLRTREWVPWEPAPGVENGQAAHSELLYKSGNFCSKDKLARIGGNGQPLRAASLVVIYIQHKPDKDIR